LPEMIAITVSKKCPEERRRYDKLKGAVIGEKTFGKARIAPGGIAIQKGEPPSGRKKRRAGGRKGSLERTIPCHRRRNNKVGGNWRSVEPQKKKKTHLRPEKNGPSKKEKGGKR